MNPPCHAKGELVGVRIPTLVPEAPIVITQPSVFVAGVEVVSTPRFGAVPPFVMTKVQVPAIAVTSHVFDPKNVLRVDWYWPKNSSSIAIQVVSPVPHGTPKAFALETDVPADD